MYFSFPLGKTCSEIKSRSTQAPSGSYVIDPDGEGGYNSFSVYCDMIDKNRVGVTILSHDSEDRTLVDGFEEKGLCAKCSLHRGRSEQCRANIWHSDALFILRAVYQIRV